MFEAYSTAPQTEAWDFPSHDTPTNWDWANNQSTGSRGGRNETEQSDCWATMSDTSDRPMGAQGAYAMEER